MADDSWRIDNMLETLRARIYEVLPDGWEFYGPIRTRDGKWRIGARSTVWVASGRPGMIESTHQDLVRAFRGLREALDKLAVSSKPN